VSTPRTGTVAAKARFANARGALFPSQFVNVRLELDTVKRRDRRAGSTAVRQGSDSDPSSGWSKDQTVTKRKVDARPFDDDPGRR
jgi:multidrug efflux system membrane fusion protein